jgi:hypothetical protein
LAVAEPIVGDAKSSVLTVLLKGASVWESWPDSASGTKKQRQLEGVLPHGLPRQGRGVLPQQAAKLVSSLVGETDIVVSGVASTRC